MREASAETAYIPMEYYRKGARGVFKATGDSMKDVGIFPGDTMFVKAHPNPPNGALVICTVNRKVYVKQLHRDDNGNPVKLLSKNPNYPTINITPGDDVEFFGIVVGREGEL